MTKREISKFLPYIICILGAMFYLYEFVLQVSPAVMTSELMRDFGLNAAGLGAVAAFYYYAYTPMQLPAGLLYDRFGTRRLMSIAIFVCACGAFFFGLTNSAAMASLGRFLMGIGSAFSFIGALLIISRWFPPKYFALLAGIVQLMSSIGAIAGEMPLAHAVELFGWRHTIHWIAIAGMLLALTVWLVVRDGPEVYDKALLEKQKKMVKPGEMERLKKVCQSRQTWLVAVYSFAVWAPIASFAALWGVPFIVAAYGFSTCTASAACSAIWIGIGVASPLIGWWSDRIGLRRLPLMLAAVIGVFALFGAIYIPHLPFPVLCIFLFFLGVAAAGQSLSFAVVKDNNHLDSVGTAIGFNNMATVAGGALFQPLIGLFLHNHWHGAVINGSPVYSSGDYRASLFVLPLCYVLAAVISWKFLRETYCHSECYSNAGAPTH